MYGTIAKNTASMSVTESSDASKMLEAALQQMDGIISGTASANAGAPADGTNTLVTSKTGLSELGSISAHNVLSTAKTLALALQQVGLTAPAPEPDIAAVISDWLEAHAARQDADERLRRLQRDKEVLATQYKQLVDRMSGQTSKIIELERLLNEKNQLLGEREEQLQRQMLSRSTLETQKLELMTALSELKLHRAALERENVELRGFETQVENSISSTKTSSSSHYRAPFGSLGNLNQINLNGSGNGSSPKTPPSALRHQIHPQYHSLPRSHNAKHGSSNNNNGPNNIVNLGSNRTFDGNANIQRQRNVAFASNEKVLIDDSKNIYLGAGNHITETREDTMFDSIISNTNSTPSPNLRERSTKGLRGIFGKLRRSNSGTLELPAIESSEAEFKRGGVARATAGGRIEWTTHYSPTSTSKAYKEWTAQEVCNWLCDLGLGCYADDCRKWLKSNSTICFFTASPVDIDRELNLKSLLHRKKIQLAIDELTGKEDDPLALKAAQLDVSWVMRWLDDIGLPQYKDPFLMAKIDGRMLHRLTMEDLSQLHVYSCLHISSLRCGIQCMREIEWNAGCLIRRSAKSARPVSELDEQSLDDDKSLEESCENIALWTAHRVMEWLRVADLSEYAPNLRGAGVHGALMLYEQRFTADLLADLLSIPPSKTLLRRHLATHFKELLGRDVIQHKRDAESSPGYQPLTITAKIKPPKKTQFSLKRRKSHKGSADVDWTDYVCPMMSACLSTNIQDLSIPHSNSNDCTTGRSTSSNTNSQK